MAEEKLSPKYWSVHFVDEVQEINDTMGNPNNYELSVESIGFMSPDSIIYNSLC